jgi:hypothetical protein
MHFDTFRANIVAVINAQLVHGVTPILIKLNVVCFAYSSERPLIRLAVT